jgi:hypothetical protein
MGENYEISVCYPVDLYMLGCMVAILQVFTVVDHVEPGLVPLLHPTERIGSS